MFTYKWIFRCLHLGRVAHIPLHSRSFFVSVVPFLIYNISMFVSGGVGYQNTSMVPLLLWKRSSWTLGLAPKFTRSATGHPVPRRYPKVW